MEEGTVYYPAINVLGSPERDEDGPNSASIFALVLVRTKQNKLKEKQIQKGINYRYPIIRVFTRQSIAYSSATMTSKSH